MGTYQRRRHRFSESLTFLLEAGQHCERLQSTRLVFEYELQVDCRSISTGPKTYEATESRVPLT